MRVMVTGAAGHTAAALLPVLVQRPDIQQVIAVDIHPPAFSSAKMRYFSMDIRDPCLAEQLAGLDQIIHLAFVVLSPRLGPQNRWRSEMRDINLRGSQHLFQAAASAGVRHVIYTSSVAAYGAWPDNPIPLDENWPCRCPVLPIVKTRRHWNPGWIFSPPNNRHWQLPDCVFMPSSAPMGKNW